MKIYRPRKQVLSLRRKTKMLGGSVRAVVHNRKTKPVLKGLAKVKPIRFSL